MDRQATSSPRSRRYVWHRALTALLVLGLIVTALPGAVSAAAELVQSYDQADLERQALASLRDGYRRLIDPTVDPAQLALVGTVGRDGRVEGIGERVARIDSVREGTARYGQRFTSAEVSLREVTVEVRDPQIILRAIEQVWLRFEVHGEALPDRMTGEEIAHEFVFEPVAGRWTLVFDRALWPYSEPQAPDPDAPSIDPSRALTHERQGRIVGGGRPASLRPVAASGTFNKAAAVDYAKRWWNGHNTYYPHYGDDDCANFMSQTKAAGGWTAKAGFYLDQNA